jgi:hypothetical protein
MYPKCKRMCNSEPRDVLRPEGFEVSRLADLAYIRGTPYRLGQLNDTDAMDRATGVTLVTPSHRGIHPHSLVCLHRVPPPPDLLCTSLLSCRQALGSRFRLGSRDTLPVSAKHKVRDHGRGITNTDLSTSAHTYVQSNNSRAIDCTGWYRELELELVS